MDLSGLLGNSSYMGSADYNADKQEELKGLDLGLVPLDRRKTWNARIVWSFW